MAAVQTYFIDQIIIPNHGQAWYEQVAEQLIFAIGVHESECWLLPLVDARDSAKISGCLQRVERRRKMSLQKKDYDVFLSLAKPYAKQNKLLKHAPQNPSLNLFVEALTAKGIEIEEDDW